MDKIERYNLDSISKILEEVDVMDIVDLCPPNEYRPEALHILVCLEVLEDENLDEAKINKIVFKIFVRQFSLEQIMEHKEKIDLIAKKIMALG